MLSLRQFQAHVMVWEHHRACAVREGQPADL